MCRAQVPDRYTNFVGEDDLRRQGGRGAVALGATADDTMSELNESPRPVPRRRSPGTPTAERARVFLGE